MDFIAALDSVSWNGQRYALGAIVSTMHYTRLLSDEWINGDLIDIMFADLQVQLPEDSENAVETLTFPYSMLSSFNRPDDPQEPNSLLRRYTERVAAGTLKRLYFPMHVNGNHWITFCVDFEKKMIACGKKLFQIFA